MSFLSFSADATKFTPEAVYANPKLLLHKALDASYPKELTFQAATLIDHGHHFVASVNVPWIPELPPTGSREVFLREDLRYGTDDYIQWPQPGGYPHFAAILRKIDEPNIYSILWKQYHANSSSFIESTSHFVMLDRADLAAFEKIRARLSSDLADYLNDSRSKHPESYKTAILIRQQLADTFFTRIKVIPMTGRELWRCMVELQRFVLEFRAALDYGVIYLPRIQGLEPPATAVANTLGTFTADPNTARQCAIAGLPVWMTQDIRSLPHTRIDCVVDFEKAEGHIVLEEGVRKYPTIFKGKATNPQRLESIYLCSRIVLHTADIFASNLNPPPARSDVPRSLNSARANADSHLGVHISHHPYRVSKLTSERRRNVSTNLVLKPPLSNLLPSILPSWLAALDSLDAKFIEDAFPNAVPSDAGYAFPNPSLLFDSTKQEVKHPMLYQWLQLRMVMLFRLGPSVPSMLSGPVSNRVWRRALQLQPATFESIRADTSAKKNSTEKREGLGFLESSVEAAGEKGGPVSLLTQSPSWRGNVIATASCFPEGVWKEAIWELSELNFRYELLALDRRLCTIPLTDSTARAARHELLLDCVVPAPMARALLIVEFHQSMWGLAHAYIRQRLPQLLNLRKLMRDWKEPFGDYGDVDPKSDDGTLLRMEEELYKYYVRRFFVVFGRAPVVPRRL